MPGSKPRPSIAACSKPAARRLLFANVKGCRFPMVSNLFGTLPRARAILGEPLERVRRLIELRGRAAAGLTSPLGIILRPPGDCGTCGPATSAAGRP